VALLERRPPCSTASISLTFPPSCAVSLTARLLVVLSITKQQYFRTLSLIVRESGWPLDVALVGPRIAARLKLDTGGAADVSGAAVDAARAKMRITAPTLEIDYQLERKPPNRKNAAEPQFWVVDEVTRPGLGLVGRDQLLAVCEALAADMIGSDVALSSTLYTFMLDFDTANRLAVKGEVKRRDAGSSFQR